ncbi:unnamed protein product [Sphacelaria rigidula]
MKLSTVCSQYCVPTNIIFYRDGNNDNIAAHAIQTVFAMREYTTTEQTVEAPTHERGLECFCCGTVVKQDMSHVSVLRLIVERGLQFWASAEFEHSAVVALLSIHFWLT